MKTVQWITYPGLIALRRLSGRHCLQLVYWQCSCGAASQAKSHYFGKKWDLLSGFCTLHRIGEGTRSKPPGNKVRNHVQCHSTKRVSSCLCDQTAQSQDLTLCTLTLEEGAPVRIVLLWAPGRSHYYCDCASPGQGGYCTIPLPHLPGVFCLIRQWFLSIRTHVLCWQPSVGKAGKARLGRVQILFILCKAGVPRRWGFPTRRGAQKPGVQK